MINNKVNNAFDVMRDAYSYLTKKTRNMQKLSCVQYN